MDKISDQRIETWLEATPNMRKYAKNKALVRKLFKKHNVAETVAQCSNEMNCKLQLMVLEIFKKNREICAKCFKSKCSNECGAEDMQPKEFVTYLASDITYEGDNEDESTVTMQYSPWDGEEHEILEDGCEYQVEGKCSVYKTKDGKERMQITIKSISKIGGEPTTTKEEAKATSTSDIPQDIRENIANLIGMFQGDKLPLERWNGIVGNYGDQALKEFKMVIDGDFVSAKSDG